jgi:integrase
VQATSLLRIGDTTKCSRIARGFGCGRASNDLSSSAVRTSGVRSRFAELTGIYRVMVFVAATTGPRVSELLGLRWLDCDFEDGEIHLTRGIVRQHETAMKTDPSRKPVPMEMGLADVLKTWRMECGYSQSSDYIFASADMDGKQPLWPNSAMEDHIRPAPIRAEITKRLGWHTLRHTFGTLLKANGEDVAVVQSLMRHANVSVTMDKYVQAVTPPKRRARAVLWAYWTQMDPREQHDRLQVIEKMVGA